MNNDCDIAILDTEKVICWNGDIARNYGEIDDNMRQMIEDRKQQVITNFAISKSLTISGECVFHPIICEGDVLGAVVVRAKTIEDAQQLSSLIAEFLINYFGA